MRPYTTQKVIDTFTEILDKQDNKGISKYNMTIDEASGYDWNIMALEEVADLMKYLVKENEKIRKERDLLKVRIAGMEKLIDSLLGEKYEQIR